MFSLGLPILYSFRRCPYVMPTAPIWKPGTAGEVFPPD